MGGEELGKREKGKSRVGKEVKRASGGGGGLEVLKLPIAIPQPDFSWNSNPHEPQL